MTGRLFRFTPHGGKPNHYTDSFRSASGGNPSLAEALWGLQCIGDSFTDVCGNKWERVA
jgi:hypothetical protein